MNSTIINLTQHPATQDQIKAGVVEPANKKEVQNLLTFNQIPNRDEIIARAEALADIALASGYKKALIGGAPYLMAPLERALKKRGIEPLYAFSIREVVEQTLPDGSTKKISIFKHAGFIPAC